jgi:sucrose-phosphate synthase
MKKNTGLYIQMFSIHGLVRSTNMEMGRDADTGGQIKYVVELASHLAQRPEVARVDLFTRLISDREVSDDYSVPVEEISDGFRIVRIQCGGKKYIRKELLWSHLDEYVDKIIKFIKREKLLPDIVHGHYADGGWVAMHLASTFGVPLVFTGHSLGRSKLEKLLGDGMKHEEALRHYKIDTRIQAEEDVLENADLVVTSTRQEVEQQYGMYDMQDMPRYTVIPPGIDLETFFPFYRDMVQGPAEELSMQARVSLMEELNRFFKNIDKPLVLALCRPDKRKNISGLIQAFGEDRELQAMANLAVFAGIRKDIADMGDNERDVLTEMLLLMDKYDLYGQMAIPKKHDFAYEVPVLYRVAAEKRGVFVNPAMTEPFGLTLIEASASGLPIVATRDGGPRDIVDNLKNGILVDAHNPGKISSAIKKLIVNSELWKEYSNNGVVNVRRHYTWEAHVESYVGELKKLAAAGGESDYGASLPRLPVGKRLSALKYFIITDIDDTLIDERNERLGEFIKLLQNNRDCIGFAVATGRTMESAAAYLEEFNVPPPDVIISSVGTEMHYGTDRMYDRGWDTHLSHRWNGERVREVLSGFEYLTFQSDEMQRTFKVSCFMEPGKDRLAEIHRALSRAKLRYNLIYSNDQFLDVLPHRASKGKALRYFSYKWEFSLDNLIVCGDSGNDEEMLRGDTLGVVVGNYNHELDGLRGMRNIFFAQADAAGGILEGLAHYGFVEKARGKR